MASYKEHIEQARSNIKFLISVSKNIPSSWDWQVTTCFYVSVHLLNAHIAFKSNQHYRSHEQVKDALNPYKQLSITKLNEKTYLAYEKLQNLSRRSRYLCNDNLSDRSNNVFFTFDIHLSKALKNLDLVMSFVASEYNEVFDKNFITCLDIQKSNLKYFIHR